MLTVQLRKSAQSIPSNISEGCGKSSRRESIRYLEIASASAFETENHVTIAGDLRYLDAAVTEQYLKRIVSIQRMLRNLINNFGGE